MVEARTKIPATKAASLIAAAFVAICLSITCLASAPDAAHAATKSLTSSKAKVTVAKKMAWTGKAIKPAVKVKYKSKTLKKNRDFKVTYKSNKAVGTAKVIVRGIGKYKGKKTRSFKIVPKKMKAPVITVMPGGKVKLSWSGNSQKTTRIEIAYAKTSSMSSATVKKLSAATAGSGTLSAGTSTCWMAVRTVVVKNGKTYKGTWTTPIKVSSSVLKAANATGKPITAEPGKAPVVPAPVPTTPSNPSSVTPSPQPQPTCAHEWVETGGKYWVVDVEAYEQSVPDHTEYVCWCGERFMSDSDLDDHTVEAVAQGDFDKHAGFNQEVIYKRVPVPEQGHWEEVPYEYRCSKCGEYSHVN